MESTTWHYPPDFMTMMVDTMPLLVRSKPDLIAFFKGAGVNERHLASLRARVMRDRSSIGLYEIAKTILYAVNGQNDDEGLRARRELVKRVSEFTAFDKCYPDKAMAARGGVAAVKSFVHARDTTIRIEEAYRHERERNIARAEDEARAARERRSKRDAIREDLLALLPSTNPSARGHELERILARLFAHDEVLVKESFTVTSPSGNGIVEQIDGVIEVDGNQYLVEMKWHDSPLGVGDVSQHFTRVFGRAQSRGIFIVHPGYTATAVETARENLRSAPFILCTLSEIVQILEAGVTVTEWLRPKIRAAVSEKEPLRQFAR
jgi:restriction system protein